MNQKSEIDPIQPYPQYISAYEQQDEISLVDLWIALLKFKRVFFASWLIMVALGILAVTIIIEPKYKMSTVLSIGRYHSETSDVIESPAAVVNRINVLILPDLTKKIMLENDLGVFETKVNNPKGTDLIVIENRVTADKQSLFSVFQNEIGLAVVDAHKDLLYELNSDLRRQIALEEAAGDVTPLSLGDFTSQYESGFRDSIELVAARVNELLGNNNSIQSVVYESKNDPLPLLVQMSDNNKEISDLISRRLGLERDLLESFSEYKREVKQRSERVLKLEKRIGTELSQISGSGELSLKPVGLSPIKGYVIVIFLGCFLAFAVTLIAMFRAKVIERMSEEA